MFLKGMHHFLNDTLSFYGFLSLSASEIGSGQVSTFLSVSSG